MLQDLDPALPPGRDGRVGPDHYLSSVGGLGFSRWGNFQINSPISS